MDEAARSCARQLIAGWNVDFISKITEIAFIKNQKVPIYLMAALRSAGVQTSIDDYGADLTSLSYLKMLNVDELKIDRSLILDVVHSARDRLFINPPSIQPMGLA